MLIASQELDHLTSQDRADIDGIDAVGRLLAVICRTTGLGFSAVARVTENSWTALAVRDEADFGLQAGQHLDVHTTLCKESRAARKPIIIDQASTDPTYASHHTPKLYNIESYVSVPIILKDGSYFGNLCALDAKPKSVSEAHIVEMFLLFAQLIAEQLDGIRRIRAAEAEAREERVTGLHREQFIAMLAHDLRNPLAAVDAGLGVLRRLVTGVSLAELVVERLGRSSQRMKSLIEDLVDFTRGRLGEGVAMELETIDDLEDALRHVVIELEGVHPERRLEASVHVPARVNGSRSRLQQLFSNLLGNALVHGSPSYPVQARVFVAGHDLHIEVSNRGAPIPEDLLPKLFEPFSTTAGTNSPRLGLGLFICAQVVRGHGGSINVSSTADAGTSFTVELPIVMAV